MMLKELKLPPEGLKTDYEIIRFVQHSSPADRETPIWGCYLTALKRNLIGVVRWCGHPDSRQFCFHPEPDAYYDANLLKNIYSFVTQATDLHYRNNIY